MGKSREHILQNYKTTCVNCHEEIIAQAVDFTGENEIIVDFLEHMEFTCHACGTVTEISIEKQ